MKLPGLPAHCAVRVPAAARRRARGVAALQGGRLLWAVLVVPLAADGAVASRLRKPYSHSYSYSQHGRDWALGACATGRQQSPVDLPAQAAQAPSGSFLYDYTPGNASAGPGRAGSAYSLDLLGQGYGGILHAGTWYPLIAITVRTPSEHTWAGRAAPAELHLVHKRHDAGALLVVAAALEGPGPSAPRASAACAAAAAAPGPGRLVQAFLGAEASATERMPVPLASPFDLNGILDGGSFFLYAGSMTVPPCAEIVTWLVRTEPIAVSSEQAQCLQGVMSNVTGGLGNNRATMPLNGREISVVSALQERRPPAAATEGAVPGSAATDRELRVAAKANEASRVAERAEERLKDVELRAQRAADLGMSFSAMDVDGTAAVGAGRIIR